MSHRNALLTPTGGLLLARCVVEDGRPLRRAAERFQVSHTTAARWADRYRAHGLAGMEDRSSRLHHQPLRTPAAVEEQVIRLRREHRIGPLRLAARAGVAAPPLTRSCDVTACPFSLGDPPRPLRYDRTVLPGAVREKLRTTVAAERGRAYDVFAHRQAAKPEQLLAYPDAEPEHDGQEPETQARPG